MVSGVGPGIHVLDGSPRQWKGLFLAWFLAFFGICACIRFIWRNNVIDVMIADRLVREKLTVFPYTAYIIEICVELAFL